MCAAMAIENPWPRATLSWRGAGIGFFAMWVFVGLVSAYDAWLVIKYWESIVQLEQNPFCQYLIAVGEGDWSIFLRAKTGGTVAVLSVLAGLYRSNRRLALPVTAAVSLFQLGLLAYLTFGSAG
ncbi:MAG TPA: hypothetical protein VG826_24650 [Pirellulales bacterium]|nr:hypothetical protein [Pirellulales bacterium]